MKVDKALLTEAAYVGLGSIPIYIGTGIVLDSLFSPGSSWRSEAMKAFVAGTAFHLMAEAGGMNQWYLENGYAAKKHRRMVYDSTLEWALHRRGFGFRNY